MERHANYALVGVLTTVLLIGGLVLAVWLGNVRAGHDTDVYRIIFQGPLRGVSVGGEVQFNGIKVGEVRSVRLYPPDTRKILVDVEVDEATPVRADSLASTEMQGISGMNAVLISAGTPSRPLLRDVSQDDPPVIRAKANALASLLSGGGKVVENANETLDRLNRLLSDRNIAALSGTLADLRLTAGEVAANRAMFAQASSALAKLDRTMDDAQRTVNHVDGLVQGDGRRAVANAADAAEELKATIAQARQVLSGLSATNGTVGNSLLPQVNDTMRGLQEVTQDLDSLLTSIRQDPRGTLLKGQSRERELKQ
ncbi:MlaD family protein [Sphingomonas sp. PL-96]|uniref:MlaD family protein n=1 Tax=Sphingomonas sp. PL-96 TaxID=2887201 RepID=UPI001E5B31E1|nr:MlaD family protein [Sphingomonas sp. PL-96]MCC2978030.1 MlaD family protein [Sphingomonas sp. PL-96]